MSYLARNSAFLLVATLLLICLNACQLNENAQASNTENVSGSSASLVDVEKPIPAEIEKKLKEQAVTQFYAMVDSDIEELDKYAPTLGEWHDFVEIFRADLFAKKFKWFSDNYEQREIAFGQNDEFDQDLFMKLTCRYPLMTIRSAVATMEHINLSDEGIVVEDVAVSRSSLDEDMFDIRLNFRHPDGGVYGMKNESCWLKERACLNHLGWNYLGRWNETTEEYFSSDLASKTLDMEKELILREKINKNKGKTIQVN